MLFLPKVSVLLSLNTNSSTVFLLSLVLLCSQILVVLMLRSQIGKSLLPWKLLELSAGHPLPRLVRTKWSRSLMGLGDLAAITTFSTHRRFPMLSSSKWCWFYVKTERMQDIYQAGFNQGILSSSNGPCRHSQDGGYHSFRSFWVGENAFRTQKCWLYFSIPHGPDSQRSPSLFCLCGRYTYLQLGYQVSSPTCSPGSWQTPPPRLSINPDKCVLAAHSLEYLGMRVSAEGCVPLSKHTVVISTFPQPSDKKGLLRFLGIINFYRRFIRGAAELLFP